jgi:hypothetical protein
MQMSINQYTKELFKYFIKEEKKLQKQGLTVNPIVSEIASL